VPSPTDHAHDAERSSESQSFRRAAQYLRMSTDQQHYSTENQAAAILIYAAARGLEIVATYRDEGKSGLTIEGRKGLQRLIADVQENPPPFDVIVVYDVSRWGRFQDADESAYYEHICKRAGVRVEYCAEPFDNDGSPLAAILKSLKRGMAAEYSRELSIKVWKGQHRQIALGFRQGGMAGYGLRRQAIDRDGGIRMSLEKGDLKNLQSDHVILVPGPREEVEVVRWIYRQYIAGDSELKILSDLRSQNPLIHGTPFSVKKVTDILTNEKYIGTCVWNKKSAKLKSRTRRNGKDEWISVPGAFEPIVDQATFGAAQAMRHGKRIRLSTPEMVARVRELYREYGYLTGPLIDEHLGSLLRRACVHTFRGLNGLYREVGYISLFDRSWVEIQRRLKSLSPVVFDAIEARLREHGIAVERQPHNRIALNNTYSATLFLSRYRTAKSHARGWHVPAVHRKGKFLLRDAERTDFFLVARLNKTNLSVMDYVFVPTAVLEKLAFRLTVHKVARAQLECCAELSDLPQIVLRTLETEPHRAAVVHACDTPNRRPQVRYSYAVTATNR